MTNENGLKLYKCLKPDCGWEWASRLPLPPRYCARCKRPNWDRPPRPLRPQSIAPAPKPKKVYPFHTIVVGEQIVLPWHFIRPDVLDDRLNSSMQRAIRQEEVRYGKKFQREGTPAGLIVKRVQ